MRCYKCDSKDVDVDLGLCMDCVPLPEVDGLRKRIDALESDNSKLRASHQKLEEVAGELVAAIDRIHADREYQGVWGQAQIHQGPYKGPTYVVELKRLRAALASHRSASKETK